MTCRVARVRSIHMVIINMEILCSLPAVVGRVPVIRAPFRGMRLAIAGGRVRVSAGAFALNHFNMKKKSFCKITMCLKKVHAGKLCHKHYQQFRKHGIISLITRYDSNEIVISNKTATITLRDNMGKRVNETIIDTSEVEKIRRYKWHLQSKGYAAARINGKIVLLHRLIHNTPNNFETDHKNRDKLDNRKANLRKCSTSQNQINSKINNNNTSWAKGVWWNRQTKKWESSIWKNNKKHYLGLFVEKQDAIKAYSEKAIKLFGDFANP